MAPHFSHISYFNQYKSQITELNQHVIGGCIYCLDPIVFLCSWIINVGVKHYDCNTITSVLYDKLSIWYT